VADATDATDADEHWAKDWVAVILAIGVATALNLITIAVLWTAVAGRSDVEGGLSENATQLLTAGISGTLGVLGAFLGYRAGVATAQRRTATTEPGGSTDDTATR
jgi:hypothetical protein